MTPRISELLTWGAIGARTVESPLQRQMALALSAPVGFKNATNGSATASALERLAESVEHRRRAHASVREVQSLETEPTLLQLE